MYDVIDRDTRQPILISCGDMERCKESAKQYVKKNPKATAVITQCHNRFWMHDGEIKSDVE